MRISKADETRPVLVGVGQWLSREDDLAVAADPLEAIEAALRRACEDAELRFADLAGFDTVALVDPIGWRAENACGLLAEHLGAHGARRVQTALGGEMGCRLLNEVAGAITLGRSRRACVAGVNLLRTALRAKAMGVKLDWPSGGSGTVERVGRVKPGVSDLEMAYGLGVPVTVYPMFENVLRAKRGRSIAEHADALGRLMTRFTKVAAENPHAWFPRERSAHELVTVSETNRMIAFPYPKYLNAVIATDQAVAILVLSAAEARRLGIPEARWVDWRGGAGNIEAIWNPVERPELTRSEALARTGQAALAAAGIELDAIDAFDLYSCFPVAVEVACEMLGLDEDDPRGFTVTGGLPYAGGPGNAYTLHALAAMVEKLRENGAASGLVTGNGWYLTKHSASVLARGPGATPALPAIHADAPEAKGRLKVVVEANGSARIDGYTVVYGRGGGPERGMIVGRLESGERFLAQLSAEPGALLAFAEEEGVGRTGRVAFRDGMNLFTPA
jgi:acetyl-CoA C-acetyltransferase